MTESKDFTNNLFQLMDETFGSKRYGIYLDEGTSLFETLGTVSAAGSAHHLPRRSRM